MATNETNNPNILKCARKKSEDILIKLLATIVVGGGAIFAVLIIGCTVIAIGYYSHPIIISTIQTIIAAALSTPWWVWILIVVFVISPTTIYGYSLYWCISKELTYSDWKSDAAMRGGITIIISTVIFLFVMMIVSAVAIESSVAIAGILISIGAAPILIIIFSVDIKLGRCIADFPGAVWNHYYGNR